MKREETKLKLIYGLIVLIILMIIALTCVVLSNVKKPDTANNNPNAAKVDVNPYPNVNPACKISIELENYNATSTAKCENGYTEYDINNVTVDGSKLDVRVIYSDKNQIKTGLFVNDKNITSKVAAPGNFKLGIFENVLIIFDKNTSDVYAFDKIGKKVYTLSKDLNDNNIIDPKTNQKITSSQLDLQTFEFRSGAFLFKTQSGTPYIVKYQNLIFEKPVINE